VNDLLDVLPARTSPDHEVLQDALRLLLDVAEPLLRRLERFAQELRDLGQPTVLDPLNLCHGGPPG
jgi:hypothetical protein